MTFRLHRRSDTHAYIFRLLRGVKRQRYEVYSYIEIRLIIASSYLETLTDIVPYVLAVLAQNWSK